MIRSVCLIFSAYELGVFSPRNLQAHAAWTDSLSQAQLVHGPVGVRVGQIHMQLVIAQTSLSFFIVVIPQYILTQSSYH